MLTQPSAATAGDEKRRGGTGVRSTSVALQATFAGEVSVTGVRGEWDGSRS